MSNVHTTKVNVNGTERTVRSVLSDSGKYWLVTVSGWHFDYFSHKVTRSQAEAKAVEQYTQEQE